MTRATPGTQLPAIGPWLPGAGLRMLFAALAAGLTVAFAGQVVVLVAGLVLTVVAAVRPRTFAAWLLLLLLGAAQTGVGDPAPWRVLVLMAGLHALHVLGAWTLLAAPGARVALAVLGDSARRYAMVQVPAQIAGLVLLGVVSETAGGARALAGLVGALALGFLAARLLLPAVRLQRGRRAASRTSG